MPLNLKSVHVTLIATSATLVCFLFLFHLSSADNPTRLFVRSELNVGQFRIATDSLNSYRALISQTRLSDPPPGSRLPSDVFPHSRTLGVASNIFVLSLPRRVDRRTSMQALSQALDLEFEYVDGVEATDASVGRAMNTLKWQRKEFRERILRNHVVDPLDGFDFPYLDADQDGTNPPDVAFNDTVSPFVAPLSSLHYNTLSATDRIPKYDDAPHLSCATPEDPFPAPLNMTELSLLPPWRILSRGMVACWMSHLEVIRKIAGQHESAVAIVLEDDVDMEFDIERRLVGMWPALPPDGWDIVMLGHCHSDEMAHPPIHGAASLRPSFAPKCTHAYAISRAGARRLSRMLSIPGFAYSRALDQAISWLIKTKRLRSYSVVPAIVAQSKRTTSDIWRPRTDLEKQIQSTNGQIPSQSSSGSDKGSKWRDYLVDSTLERIEMLAAEDLT